MRLNLLLISSGSYVLRLNIISMLLISLTISLVFPLILMITQYNAWRYINFSIANHWADFARISGRTTNNSSQQHFFDNDLGFEFTDQASKRILW